MLGITHIATGMALQRGLKRPWLVVPAALLSHGLLDASAVYHEYSADAMIIIGLLTAPVVFLAIRTRLWLGALFAVLPDAEWAVKWLLGQPAHPISQWQYHRWLQLPSWNWHGQYGALWGVAVEFGLAAVLLWLIWRIGADAKAAAK